VHNIANSAFTQKQPNCAGLCGANTALSWFKVLAEQGVVE
jgi:hypothetical protein